MNISTPDPKAGRLWKWAPVLLLGTALTGWAFMVRLAVDDPGFAVEKDYYQKAVSWDASAAQRRASAELGWKATFSLEGAEDGATQVVAQLQDAHAQPLEGAHAKAEVFLNARAFDRQNLVFHERTRGVYVARLERPRIGLWEVRFEAERAGTRFSALGRPELARASGTP